MKIKKRRLVSLMLAVVLVLSTLAGFETTSAQAAGQSYVPIAPLSLTGPPIQTGPSFRLYHGQVAGRNTLRLEVLNPNPPNTGANAIRFTTPGPADGWPTDQSGRLYIEGLPANSRWFLTVNNIVIDVDSSGSMSVVTGNLNDIWPQTILYLRRVGAPTYIAANDLYLGSHPRVFFTGADVQRLSGRRTLPDNIGTGANMGFVTNNNAVEANAAWTGTIGATQAYSGAIRDAIEANAFKFAMGDGYQYGARAIELAVAFGHAYLATNPTNNRQFNRVVRTLSMAYSWTYNHPTMYNNIGGARDDLLAAIIGILDRPQNDSGFLFPRMSPVTGHGGEEGILFTQLMAGIAIYDEFPALLDFVYNRIMEDFVPVRNWMFRSGSNGQGSGYGPNRFQFDMYALALLQPLGVEPFNEYMPELMRQTQVYWRFPNGRTVVAGDCFWSYSKAPGSYWNLDSTESWLAASLFNCGIMQWEAHPNRSFRVGNDPLFQLILRNHEIPMVSPLTSNLPLTRFWDGPFPSMTARTAWVENPGMNTAAANANAIVVEMRMPRYYSANHQMLDVGSFQIYYKGWLAITAGDYASGYWDGGNFPIGAPGHDFNFNKRTISHNLVTVVDPYEEWPAWTMYWHSNDGGQRAPNRLREPTSFENWMNPPDPNDNYQMSNLLGAHYGGGSNPAVAPAFSFMAGDLNYAYTDKINRYQRSMVFLNLGQDSEVPGAFLVYDTLGIRNADYETTWRLHSIDQPVQATAPDGVEIRSIIDKQPFGGVAYRGRLINDTLLPAGAQLTIIGGQGYHHWIRHFTQSARNRAAANPTARFSHLVNNVSPTHGPGHNFLPVNSATAWQNYPNINHPTAQKIEDTGGWRIEVSPGGPSNNHEFLNVIQIMDRNNAGAEMVPVLLEAEDYRHKMVGANIENWDVWFSRSTNAISTGFTIYTSQNAEELLITGVAPGNWYWYHHGNGVYEFRRTNFAGATLYNIPTVSFATYLVNVGGTYTKDQFHYQNMTFYVIHLSDVVGHLPVMEPGLYDENLIGLGGFEDAWPFAAQLSAMLGNIVPGNFMWHPWAGGGAASVGNTDPFEGTRYGVFTNRLASARHGFYQDITPQLNDPTRPYAGPGLYEFAGAMRAVGSAPSVPEYLTIALFMGPRPTDGWMFGEWQWLSRVPAHVAVTHVLAQPIATDADMNVWHEMRSRILLEESGLWEDGATVFAATSRMAQWSHATEINTIHVDDVYLRRVESVAPPQFTRAPNGDITITSDTNWARIYFRVVPEGGVTGFPQAGIRQVTGGFESYILPGQTDVFPFTGPLSGILETDRIYAIAILCGWNHSTNDFSNLLPDVDVEIAGVAGVRTHAFNTVALQVGYTQAEVEALELTVTVVNDGAGAATNLRVVSTGQFDIIQQPDATVPGGGSTTFVIRPQHGIAPPDRSALLGWTTDGTVTLLGNDGISITIDLSFMVDHIFGVYLETIDEEDFVAPDGYDVAPELQIRLTVPPDMFTGNADLIAWTLEGIGAASFEVVDVNRATQGHVSTSVHPVGSDGWVQEVRTTVRPIMGLAVGDHTARFRVTAAKGVVEFIYFTFTVLPTYADGWELISITPPAAVTGVPLGSPATVAGLRLPARVTLVTDHTPILANVVWDLSGIAYDPALSVNQTFTVPGTVVLPNGVYNTAGVPLTVTVQVSVNAPMLAPVGPNIVIDPSFEDNAFGPRINVGAGRFLNIGAGRWYPFSGPGNYSSVYDPAGSISGLRYGRVTGRPVGGNAADYGFYQDITQGVIDAGGPGIFEVSGWMRVAGATPLVDNYLFIAVPSGEVVYGGFNAYWLPGVTPWNWIMRPHLDAFGARRLVPGNTLAAVNQWVFMENRIVVDFDTGDPTHRAVVMAATTSGADQWNRPSSIHEIHADDIFVGRVAAVATPVITRDGTTGYVTITSATPFARIYYSIDSAAPTANISLTPTVSDGTAYIAPFPATANCVIRAIAVLDGWNNSAVAVWAYQPAPTVTFNPAAVALNDTNLTQTVTVEGTATGNIAVSYTIPSELVGVSVTWAADAPEVTVTGVRPTTDVQPIVGSFDISVTRQGVTETFTVDVNLTTTWTAAPTIILDPSNVAVTDTALVHQVEVDGTATGVITLDYAIPATLNGFVTVAVVNDEVVVTGVRPTTDVLPITGSFDVEVTRQGVSAIFTVTVSLTTTWTAVPTIIFTPPYARVDNNNLTSTITVGGTATGPITISGGLPVGVTAVVNGYDIMVTAVRPTEWANSVVGKSMIFVTREGVTEILILSVHLYPPLPTILQSVTSGAALNVTLAPPVTANALGLPTTVDILTSEDNLPTVVAAAVTWDTSALPFDPNSTAPQTFNVYGLVTLPPTVENPHGIPLTTFVVVTLTIDIPPPPILQSVASGAVLNVTAQPPVTADALGLPATVDITTSEGNFPAAVTWDTSALPFDPGNTAPQTFNVYGLVTLPPTVENPHGVPLTTFVVVTLTIDIPPPTSTVTIANGGTNAAVTGGAYHRQGATVTINAGVRAGYNFAGWTFTPAVTFATGNTAATVTTRFIMPDTNVTATANWATRPADPDPTPDPGAGAAAPQPPRPAPEPEPEPEEELTVLLPADETTAIIEEAIAEALYETEEAYEPDEYCVPVAVIVIPEGMIGAVIDGGVLYGLVELGGYLVVESGPVSATYSAANMAEWGFDEDSEIVVLLAAATPEAAEAVAEIFAYILAGIAANDPINTALLEDLIFVSVEVDGYVLENSRAAISVDVSGLGLTPEQMEAFTAIFFNEDTGEYVLIPGQFCEDGTTFTFYAETNGLFAIIVGQAPEIPPPPIINTAVFTVGTDVYTVNDALSVAYGTPFIDPATDRMMIPLRSLANSFGVAVDWNGETRTAYVFLAGGTLAIPVHEQLPDGMGSAHIVNDRVFVPARFVMYAFGANVYWDEENRAANIFW